MDKLKKIGAAIAGIGILAIALYLAAFVFVILLIIGLVLGIYIWLKGGKIRAEFKRPSRANIRLLRKRRLTATGNRAHSAGMKRIAIILCCIIR